jgi:hypothetical protein
MSYYPLSQIKTNIYSNKDLVTEFGEFYTGYYWKNSKGKFFSGRTPQDTPSQELFISLNPNPLADPPNPKSNDPISQVSEISPINTLTTFPGDPDPTIMPFEYKLTNFIVDDYDTLKPFSIRGSLPLYSPAYPTTQDYQIGEFRRFFCKKTNEIQYIEIDLKQYDLLIYKDPQILWQLYFPFNIPWAISGQISDVSRVNKNVVELTMKQLKLPRFNDYLKNDYTKYFI